ncbi:MAG: hypothetical protein HUK11_05330 [Muribaculaceae bacterium]|nr:hypothetical protein [Muribaculaceae bacterium]
MKQSYTDYKFEYQRKKREIELLRSTVKEAVKDILPKEGITYCLETTEHGLLLLVKMTHGRVIKVNFNRRNYIKTIEKLLPALLIIIDTFEKVGTLRMQVTASAYRYDWLMPESFEQDSDD